MTLYYNEIIGGNIMSKENYWKHLLRVEQEELQELRRQQEQQKLDDELEGHYQNN